MKTRREPGGLSSDPRVAHVDHISEFIIIVAPPLHRPPKFCPFFLILWLWPRMAECKSEEAKTERLFTKLKNEAKKKMATKLTLMEMRFSKSMTTQKWVEQTSWCQRSSLKWPWFDHWEWMSWDEWRRMKHRWSSKKSPPPDADAGKSDNVENAMSSVKMK